MINVSLIYNVLKMTLSDWIVQTGTQSDIYTTRTKGILFHKTDPL